MSRIQLNDNKPMRIQSGRSSRADPKTGKPIIPYAFLHPCRHPGCEREGVIGVGVNLKRRKPGVWFCHEHRADADAIGEHPAGLDW